MPCPFEHMTRDWQLHDVAQFDMLNIRGPHRFSQKPSTHSCVAIAAGADFSAILRLVFACKALGNAALS